MSPTIHRLLRYFTLFVGSLHTFFIVWNILTPPTEQYRQTLFNWKWFVNLIPGFLLLLIGMILAFRLKEKSYHIFLACFLVLLGSNYTLDFATKGLPEDSIASISINIISSWLAACMFIFSFMRFSGHLSPQVYQEYFKHRWRPGFYKRAVIFFSGNRSFWLGIGSFLLVFAAGNFWIRLVGDIFSLIVLVLGLIYFRITFYASGPVNRNRLRWLLWGLITTISLYFLYYILYYLIGITYGMNVVLYILLNSVICFSFIMAIFFSKATDAKWVVHKTLLYSILLITGLLVYGTIEHYLIHSISHALHIQSSVLNSILGAAIALLLRPLHHKVEHWLNRLEHKKTSQPPVAKEITDTELAGS